MKNKTQGSINKVIYLVKRNNGETERYVDTNNITVGGFELVGSRLGGLGGDGLSHIAIGTDGSAENVNDTTLGNEVLREEAQLSLITTTFQNDTLQIEAGFTFSSNTDVRESGVFNNATSGIMYARSTRDVISLQDGDELNIVWRIQNTENT